MTHSHKALVRVVLCLSIVLVGPGCPLRPSLEDDAGGRTAESFPESASDVFREMDGGIQLTPEEIKGRNTWNLWTGGNEQFWDRIAREGYGMFDLLKTVDSRRRGTRFRDMGLINEPGFRQASAPDAYGLWIDERVSPEPAGIDPQVFGRSSGVMGFRLFPNPSFDAAAQKKWDATRYYNDASYAVDPALVRPYRVGVSCGACHIAFNPVKPPADPENPGWENLASAIANQYIREGRVFGVNVQEGGFFAEMLKAQPPGTSDTSRIATDHVNNPNAINAIFSLDGRLSVAQEETMAGETLLLPGEGERMKVPHILKDGADSVGVAGATIRVYVNIGLYHQHWLQQHNALVGLTSQKPFSIAIAQKHSVYWRATEQKLPNIVRFFRRIQPMRLADAPGGAAYITRDQRVMTRGKVVFAAHCASCHSSKRPPAGVDEEAWFKQEVLKPDFLDGNFLSDDQPRSIVKIQTNAARACGSNAKRGHVWENFSSETYKQRPAVGEIEVWNPYSDSTEKWPVPDGGSGYYRPPSLVAVWSSAPLLHNNALGKFTGDPSVAGRMEAFSDAIEKLLWPEKRLGKASIWRTSRESALQLRAAVIPEPLRTLLKPHTDPDGFLRIGPIPEGTPINLLANLSPRADPVELVKLCVLLKRVLLEIKLQGLDSARAKELMKTELAPALLRLSTCPDLVEDRGHYFGADLPDPDKRALIEYLKTL